MLPPQDLDQPITSRRAERARQLGEEVCRFRELIGKLGSGERTSTGLSRSEASEALTRMLTGQTTDTQIGAFLIAHRLRRPRPEEMAGFLDAYSQLGPALPATTRPVVSFGAPFDGRCREAPLLPLTALVLASAGVAVVLQGGAAMPVKYGATTAELLTVLDLPFSQLDWPAMGRCFGQHGLALLHQPRHFPAAETLVPSREQIGKRPPIATLELLWSCYAGPHLPVSGFVHAPTEALAWQTWTLTRHQEGLTIKGLEGGVDLPSSRVAIAAHWRRGSGAIERLVLQARDHGLRTPEVELTTLRQWRQQALAALHRQGPLASGLIWNAGFYLWRLGTQPSLEAGLRQAEALLRDGTAEDLRARLVRELPGPPPHNVKAAFLAR
jgi:anthranilate phosphoribosyltransferase